MKKQLQCTFCESNSCTFFKKIRYSVKDFTLYRCQNCHAVFQHPLPTKKELETFYSQIYQKQCNLPCAEAAFEVLDEKQEEGRFKEIKRFVRKGVLLDVGASTGFFLSIVRKDKNWKGMGVEYVKSAVDEAWKRFKLKLYLGEVSDVPHTNYFDVVTMHSVLEHIPDQRKTVKEVYKNLKKGGIFVFNVPHISSFEYQLYEVLGKNFPGFIYEHLYYYTEKAISSLLTSEGFTLLEVTSRHHSSLSLPPKRPLIGWLTFLPKLFFEYTYLGGKCKKGNILYIYAQKQ